MANGPNSQNLVFGTDCARCPVTGRHYEQGSGALSHEDQTASTRTVQTRHFLDELSPEVKAQRAAAARALHDVEPAGRG